MCVCPVHAWRASASILHRRESMYSNEPPVDNRAASTPPPQWRQWGQRALLASLTLGAAAAVMLMLPDRDRGRLNIGPPVEEAGTAEEAPVFYELDIVIKSERHRVLHSRIEGRGSVTFELTFTDKEAGSDTCYSMYHSHRLVSGWYHVDSSEDDRIPLTGVYTDDTLTLYAQGDEAPASSGVRCGVLIDDNNDEKEVEYKEKFVFTEAGASLFSSDATARTVEPIHDFRDDIVETSVLLVKPDGEEIDLTSITEGGIRDILQPWSDLFYKRSYRRDSEISVLLINYNDNSCLNDYTSATQIRLNADTLEVVENEMYFIARCDKFFTDLPYGDATHTPIVEDRVYTVYSYPEGEAGSERDGWSIGSFTVREARISILETWY